MMLSRSPMVSAFSRDADCPHAVVTAQTRVKNNNGFMVGILPLIAFSTYAWPRIKVAASVCFRLSRKKYDYSLRNSTIFHPVLKFCIFDAEARKGDHAISD
jgi:hypothetical protein